MSPKVALVTGANGITGGAIVNYLVTNTTPQEWSRIVVTSRRPLATKYDDPRVSFVSLDLLQDQKTLIDVFKKDASDVTHAYFSAYIHREDFQELNRANTGIFDNFLDALEASCANLANVTLQTGGKYYGCHLAPVFSPCLELQPRGSDPENFYYHQEDILAERQRGKLWTWNVIRPDAIVGFTPHTKGMSIALNLALYFLLCKFENVPCQMPSNKLYFEGYDDMSYAPLIADLTLFASTQPQCVNQAFNCANGDYVSWRWFWARLAAYFGIDVCLSAFVTVIEANQ